MSDNQINSENRENYEVEGYEDIYGEDEGEEYEVGGELPPEAREYYEYKNQIDIMEKEKQLLESTLRDAKQSYYSKKSLEKTKNYDCNYTNYKDYEKKILNKMMEEDQLFGGVGTSKDILGSFVDKVLERSLYVYRNRHCHTCAKLLNMGKSTQKCPKCHHLLRELNNQRKKNIKNKKY